jgi:hypothetical protein
LSVAKRFHSWFELKEFLAPQKIAARLETNFMRIASLSRAAGAAARMSAPRRVSSVGFWRAFAAGDDWDASTLASALST